MQYKIMLITRMAGMQNRTRSHTPFLLTPPPPQLNKSGLKLVCNVNIVNIGSADTTNETED
jgi:hypothetical protein